MGGGQFGGIGLGLGIAPEFVSSSSSSSSSLGLSGGGCVGRAGCVGRTVPGFVQHTPNICNSDFKLCFLLPYSVLKTGCHIVPDRPAAYEGGASYAAGREGNSR